jgi:hypothetical protein
VTKATSSCRSQRGWERHWPTDCRPDSPTVRPQPVAAWHTAAQIVADGPRTPQRKSSNRPDFSPSRLPSLWRPCSDHDIWSCRNSTVYRGRHQTTGPVEKGPNGRGSKSIDLDS